ncbi:MAG: NADP-dependent malic enzyme [Rhodospirillaceae bacterium]|nr:NADP-dependent malic enzyme [Rhodospirillaceae bacterium]MBT6218824.1 NADP-dependent malic enzyme [Rhodospirillaceae bacterium]
MNDRANKLIDQEALRMHAQGRPGKVEIHATKPMITQSDLTLAYSPGVAAPCLEINRDPVLAYKYTAMGNIVAVISNGTAVLGLGNIGALAAKPVMEGKSVLFKRFADIDGINLEIHTEDVDEFVNCVRYLGNSFGGINLEDIKAPECFIIEQRLRELLDVPVFHDDQHGTAIITAAGLINALELTGRTIDKTKMVVNGAGAASIACVELFKALGMPGKNIVLCDTKGVIFEGRKEGMNQWKSAHAAKTKMRTLAEAIIGADCFVGLSVKDAMTADMVRSMANNPLIFAMANPDPEITPEAVKAVRDDAIIATGRSDYPNQINNVLGFPYIFRGALDVRASTINNDMKIAAAKALAALAREDVPDEVAAAYSGEHLKYGREYLIPTPFDPRLITAVPMAVAQAAMDSSIARNPIIDMDRYEAELSARLNPTASSLQAIFDVVRANPRRVVFAEGEEEKSIRAAFSFMNSGYGTPILIGREKRVGKAIEELGLGNAEGIEITNAQLNPSLDHYTEFLYRRVQRKGYLQRDCQRMVKRDRNIFAACMVATGDADAMVTGLTRNYHVALTQITQILDPDPGGIVFGLSLVLARDRTLFVADTAVHELPSPVELADIAQQAADVARQMGHDPRVALLSFANFGQPELSRSKTVRLAVEELDKREVNFEYDGEMGVDVALNTELMANYPFCRLTGPANILVMPGLHSAQISSKLLYELGGSTVVGPLLIGLSKPAQIVPMGANTSDMVNMAALAAHSAR